MRKAAWLLRHHPAALKAAPFRAISQIQERISTAATACRKPEARPAVGPRRVSEFAHRVLLLFCDSCVPA